MTEPSRDLAVVPPTPPREIAVTDTDSWVEVMRPILALAEKVYDTDFVPKGLRGNAGATAAAMLYGREVGLPPMTSLNVTHVVEGKPGISAEAMRAMVLAAGHELEFVETTGAVCIMRGRRRGVEKWTELGWSIDMARAAGLTGKNNWKHYPRRMLQARCTSELCEMIFPDVIHGFRSVEELEDTAEGEDGAADGSAAPTGGTKVGRKPRTTKKAVAKKTTATPAALPPGPPLPGEAGFDEPTQTTGGGDEPGDGGTATRDAESSGEDSGAEPAPPSVPDAPDPDSPPAPRAGPVGPGSGAQAGEEADEAGTPSTAHPAEPDSSPADETVPAAKVTRAQQRMIMGEFSGFGMADDREERLLATSIIVGREVESTNDLTKAEASTLIDTLSRVETREKLNTLLDTIEESRKAQADAAQGDES